MTTTPPSRTLEDIAIDLAESVNQLKSWEERRRSLLDELDMMRINGLAPEKFQVHGITYTRQAGRITYDYSQAPSVQSHADLLKQAQEEAKALGLAVAKIGAGTWRVTTARDA